MANRRIDLYSEKDAGIVYAEEELKAVVMEARRERAQADRWVVGFDIRSTTEIPPAETQAELRERDLFLKGRLAPKEPIPTPQKNIEDYS